MGILRGVTEELIEPLVETALRADLRTLEITMNTKGASNLIRKSCSISKGRIAIGAGTVINIKNLDEALDAGASFIVMPVLVKEVVARCVKLKVPVFPGALTPLEIYDAWRAGATMVKVFPSGLFGPGYFKEIKGPFDEIELLACGGVTPGNMKAYFENGAGAIAFGSSVFRQDWLTKKDFKSIENSIKQYAQNYR